MALTKIPANLLDKSSHVDFADNEQIRLGNTQGLLIYHSGTHSHVRNTSGGNLYLQDDGYVEIGSPSGEVYIGAIKDGAVNLRYDNNTKLTTTSSGVTVTGSISGATATAAAGTNTTALASTAFVQQEITSLIGGAPGTLDTLNELAAAINDDSNYNSTLTTALATKLPLAGGTMTGNLLITKVSPKLTLTSTGSGNDSEIYMSTAANGRGFYIDDNDTNKLKFYTGYGKGAAGREVTFDNAGNIGIGTTSPANKLHVKAGASGASTFDSRYNLILEDDGENYIGVYSPTNSYGGLRFLNSASSIRGYIDYYHGSQGDKMQIYAQNEIEFNFPSVGEQVTFKSGGSSDPIKVGIGTNAPLEKLQIDAGNIVMYKASASSSANASLGHISGRGRVGSTDPLSRIDFQSGPTYYHGAIDFQLANDYAANALSSKMRLTTVGLGIGTETPAAPLHVAGKVMAGNVLTTHGHANADDFIVGDISNAATGMTIVSAGTGNIHFSDGTSSGNANIQGQLVYAHNDNSMRFYTAVAEKMRLKSTGHLTLNHVNHSFSGVDNSLLASSNGYMYAMGGSSGLYLADNSALNNAIGIRDANYIDFTTNGQNTLKFDLDGIHFQRADGQKISAKESIIMEIDEDNNSASRVFQVRDGSGNVLLNLHDDYRTEVGTLQFSSTRSAGYSSSNGLGASAGDWVDIASVPYGRNIATIKLFWDAIYAPSSSHHGNMEFDIGSHYGTSYYYGWDTYINLKASSAHNQFYISEARIISPGGSGATGYFQVKFGVATGTQGNLRAYVTHRDEQCSIDPITPVVNNSRNGGTTLAQIKLGDNGGFTNNRVGLATSRDMHIGGGLTIATQPSAMAHKSGHYTETSGTNNVTGWNTQHNIGNDFNASTGVFTCPTDGRYLCTFSPMSGQTTGDVQFRILRNSALLLGSNSMSQGGGPWRQTTVTGVIDCDAGDTLRPAAYSSTTSSIQQVYTGSYSTLSFHFLG